MMKAFLCVGSCAAALPSLAFLLAVHPHASARALAFPSVSRIAASSTRTNPGSAAWWFQRNYLTHTRTRSSFSSPSSSFLLRYRAIDELDDEADPLMVKVQSRAPKTNWFGMDMVKKTAVSREEVKEKKGQLSAEPPKTKMVTAMNIPLIRALLLNQLLILALGVAVAMAKLVTSDGFEVFKNLDSILDWAPAVDGIFSGHSHASVWDLSLDPDRVLLGVGGSLPLLAVSNRIENSDRRAFANVNFSTIVMVMTLFGRRKGPPPEFIPENFPVRPFPTTPTIDVAAQSFIMSSVTALCEESVFRRFVPAVIASSTGGNTFLAYLGQAVLFGLGHSNPKSPSGENAIVVGLQIFNGLGFGLLYLLSGGDLVPCVVAHALYDFVTFFGTWMSSNGQLEYAERMYSEPLSRDVEEQVRQLLSRASGDWPGRGGLDPKLYRIVKRLFYLFDFDKNKTLSLSEVRKGVAYMALERAGTPPPQEQVDAMFLAAVRMRGEQLPPSLAAGEDRLSFADFLRLYLSMLGRSSSGQTLTA